MSFFICENCKYTFIREEQPERCPDCGKLHVRMAKQMEILRHIQDMQEEGLVGLSHQIPA